MVLRSKIGALNFCGGGTGNLLSIFVGCSPWFFPDSSQVDAKTVLYGNKRYFPVPIPTDLHIQ